MFGDVFDIRLEVEGGTWDDSQVEELGDEVIEQPSTSNARLDVILLISDWVKGQRADRAAVVKDRQRRKRRA